MQESALKLNRRQCEKMEGEKGGLRPLEAIGWRRGLRPLEERLRFRLEAGKRWKVGSGEGGKQWNSEVGMRSAE